MLKIALFIVLFNMQTGELVKGSSQGFETVAACEQFVKDNEPKAPVGYKWYHKCINPSLIDVSL